MTHPFFSIIIPAYNIGKLVEDAIDSCLRQKGIDLNELEVIVIDDGSTDETPAIVDKYASYPTVKIIHQKNRGLSGARNTGIEVARGEYLLFLDGDDWLADGALALLKPACHNQQLVMFPMIYWYNPDKYHADDFGLKTDHYSADDLLARTFGNGIFNVIPAPCKAYPTKLLRDNGIRFTEGILHEDNPFFLQSLHASGEVSFIETPVYYYRQNRDGSITSRHTIRNFHGVLEGNEIIKSIYSYGNSDVNFLLASLHTFQVILPFTDGNKPHVRSYYRSWQSRREIWRLLNSISGHRKVRFKLFLLLIDPLLLQWTASLLYGKNN